MSENNSTLRYTIAGPTIVMTMTVLKRAKYNSLTKRVVPSKYMFISTYHMPMVLITKHNNCRHQTYITELTRPMLFEHRLQIALFSTDSQYQSLHTQSEHNYIYKLFNLLLLMVLEIFIQHCFSCKAVCFPNK